jgi:hypothetical protein
MNLQIASSPISFGMQGDDVARVQQALQALGREIPPTEIASRVAECWALAASPS